MRRMKGVIRPRRPVVTASEALASRAITVVPVVVVVVGRASMLVTSVTDGAE